MVDRMPSLTECLPDMRRYLLECPIRRFQILRMSLQEVQFGLKPTIRINHLVIQERAKETVVVSKMLDANHYVWTALELRVLAGEPARGPS